MGASVSLCIFIAIAIIALRVLHIRLLQCNHNEVYLCVCLGLQLACVVVVVVFVFVLVQFKKILCGFCKLLKMSHYYSRYSLTINKQQQQHKLLHPNILNALHLWVSMGCVCAWGEGGNSVVIGEKKKTIVNESTKPDRRHETTLVWLVQIT